MRLVLAVRLVLLTLWLRVYVADEPVRAWAWNFLCGGSCWPLLISWVFSSSCSSIIAATYIVPWCWSLGRWRCLVRVMQRACLLAQNIWEWIALEKNDSVPTWAEKHIPNEIDHEEKWRMTAYIRMVYISCVALNTLPHTSDYFTYIGCLPFPT